MLICLRLELLDCCFSSYFQVYVIYMKHTEASFILQGNYFTMELQRNWSQLFISPHHMMLQTILPLQRETAIFKTVATTARKLLLLFKGAASTISFIITMLVATQGRGRFPGPLWSWQPQRFHPNIWCWWIWMAMLISKLRSETNLHTFPLKSFQPGSYLDRNYT